MGSDFSLTPELRSTPNTTVVGPVTTWAFLRRAWYQEEVSLKSILLAVSAAVVVLALAYLSIEVRAAPAPVSAAKIDEARGRAKRTRTAPSPANVSDPWGPSRSERDLAAESQVDKSATPRIAPVAEPVVAEPEVNTLKTAPVPDVDNDPRLELSSAKDEVNRMYDKQDYEGALTNGVKVLEKEPGDIRMLRVVVSAACQLGDADKAQLHWAQLPPHDQSQMTRRCQRFGITFKE